MKITYFKTTDGYAAVSNESPKGFKGTLYITQVGDTPESVEETAVDPRQLSKWAEVDVNDLPGEWAKAFGIEEPAAPEVVEPEVVEPEVVEPEALNYVGVVLFFVVATVGIVLLDMLLQSPH